MATLNLTRVWVNRLDTGEAVSAQSAVERSQEHAVAGDVRTYAGGRQRAVTQAGVASTFEFTLRFVTLATVTTLKAWIGVPVLVRDARGQAFTGVYFKVPPAEHRSPLDYDVTLSLRVVTTDGT